MIKLDDKDRAIISMYAKDPDVSQEEIGEKIELSQPSVAARVRKLKEGGAIETHTGVNPLKMGLSMAKVDVSTNNARNILDVFKNCPYFANGFTISGNYNLCLLFVSENISTLETIVNTHVRANPSVTGVEFNIIINAEKDMVIPTILTPDITEEPPCGLAKDCEECKTFHEKRCMGCPNTGSYQGWLY